MGVITGETVCYKVLSRGDSVMPNLLLLYILGAKLAIRSAARLQASQVTFVAWLIQVLG